MSSENSEAKSVDDDMDGIPATTVDPSQTNDSNTNDSDPSINFEKNNHKKQANLRFAWIVIHYPCRIIGVFFIIFCVICYIDYLGFEFSGTANNAYYIKGDTYVCQYI